MLTIISGGQTGVDRAALDVAIELGIPYRGWCPKGGWVEDRPSPPGVLALYPGLRETPDADPRPRTEWNVRDCDRLMVLVDRAGLPASKGTAFALDCAKALAKPHIVIDIDADGAKDLAADFLSQGQGPLAVCIAGPRESEAPGIYAKAKGFLSDLLAGVADSR
jgi:Circularly permutated YpsA SLOG family